MIIEARPYILRPMKKAETQNSAPSAGTIRRPRTKDSQPDFLPMNRRDMDRLGWRSLDILLISGDAYVDHPSFGTALLGRWLVAHGFRVGVIAQPRWEDTEDILRLGQPRLFVGVTAGALDSQLAHYTAFRKKRSDDAYTPGGLAGARPNRATLVYANLVRQAFPGLPVILGGIEASLRRVSHYDFWADKLRRSILLDSKADLLIYGMGELALLEAAERLRAVRDREGEPRADVLAGISGSAYAGGPDDLPPEDVTVLLPSHEEIKADSFKLVEASLALERQVHRGLDWAVQKSGDRYVIVAPPARALTVAEMDSLYGLPFTRRPHPMYKKPIPAVEMIADSITSHRGCAGGCAFCSLALHQGRRIQSRSRDSILAEVDRLAADPEFKGSLSDVGGPSGNMWGGYCLADQTECRRESCLFPKICPKFKADQSVILDLLRAVLGRPGVKHVRVASGIRYDLALTDQKALEGFLTEFVGGQLKVAPEHVSDGVLQLMRKPGQEVFHDFLRFFYDCSRKAGKEQYVVPYLMSALPGCSFREMEELDSWLRARRWRPQQVQCFVPTPGTVATAMYYSGRDTRGNIIHVARTDAERMRQHGFLAPREQTRRTDRRDGRRPDGRDRNRRRPDNNKDDRRKSARRGPLGPTRVKRSF